METYKNYQIEKNEWGYYQAIDLKDCDAVMLHNESLEDLKAEINIKIEEETYFNKHSLNSIVTEGKGVDRYITYMEYKDGTPLSEEELDSILDNHDLHLDLLSAKVLN